MTTPPTPPQTAMEARNHPFSGIRITHHVSGEHMPSRHQVELRFANGYTLSAVYGWSVYSTDEYGCRFRESASPDTYAGTVEVQITDPHGAPVPFKDGEGVKGFTAMDELFSIITWVSTR